MKRRSFLNRTVSAGALAGLGDLGFLERLPAVGADEAMAEPHRVRLHPEIEPLVRLLENTPRERVLEEIGERLRRGTTYRELLAALLLAGVRNIQPRPVGFKFHAVLVIHSAHLASLSSPEGDRWLPIFWAIDQFKSSQARDVREGDWTMGPVEESKIPPAHRARQAFIDAMDQWDEAGADAAVAGLARHHGAHEIFGLFCRYGMRDFREIGHKQIYVANSFRTLESIGWHHAEPILRSLAYALLDRDRDRDKGNPSKLDLPADRPFRDNLETVRRMRSDWLGGKPDTDASTEMLESLRTGSPAEASAKVVELINRGVAPGSLFDACFAAAGELLMRAPGILSLHATTFTNAMRYAWQQCGDDETRRLLLLQNAAFLPLFRSNNENRGPRVDTLEPEAPQGHGSEAVAEIFEGLVQDRLGTARKVLGYLQQGGEVSSLADGARRLIFLKGRDSHDYKFSSAVLEDYLTMAPAWRDRFLAASVFNLKGTSDADSDLVPRTRAALGG